MRYKRGKEIPVFQVGYMTCDKEMADILKLLDEQIEKGRVLLPKTVDLVGIIKRGKHD